MVQEDMDYFLQNKNEPRLKIQQHLKKIVKEKNKVDFVYLIKVNNQL